MWPVSFRESLEKCARFHAWQVHSQLLVQQGEHYLGKRGRERFRERERERERERWWEGERERKMGVWHSDYSLQSPLLKSLFVGQTEMDLSPEASFFPVRNIPATFQDAVCEVSAAVSMSFLPFDLSFPHPPLWMKLIFSLLVSYEAKLVAFRSSQLPWILLSSAHFAKFIFRTTTWKCCSLFSRNQRRLRYFTLISLHHG